MEEKRRKTEHLDGREFLRLNFVIMDTAIRGRSWCEAWTDLHWIVLHSYVFVYIEDHLTQATRYRIFRCEDMADFSGERQCAGDPALRIPRFLAQRGDAGGQFGVRQRCSGDDPVV